MLFYAYAVKLSDTAPNQTGAMSDCFDRYGNDIYPETE